MRFIDFIEHLENEVENLTSKDMKELADFFPADYIIGLELKLKSKLSALCNELNAENQLYYELKQNQLLQKFINSKKMQ